MHVLITGGTGFIGSALCDYFLQQSTYKISVLSRTVNKILSPAISVITDLNDPSQVFDIIINLAGEPLNKNRWNEEVKKKIYQSRLQTTQKIITYIQQASQKPQLLISGSAIGYYGSSDQETFTESSIPTELDFTRILCRDWENIALQAVGYGVRVCLLRTGIVLGKKGGALKELSFPFKFGLGAQLGEGQQWMSWIHLEDVVQVISFLIQNKTLTGPFNLTSPNPLSHKAFIEILAKTLHRPCFLKLPVFLVNFLFGEMGKTLLLKGQKVIPEKLLKAGYKFKFPLLEGALANLFNSDASR